MKVLAFIIVVALIVVSVVVLPDLLGRPSEARVEEAVLRDIAGGIYYYDYRWVREVEVIEYGKPYTANFLLVREYKFWPVRVYFIGDQRKEEKEVLIYKDEFGEWRAFY